jgi:cytochrome c oxidase assembly protein subunit 15
MAHDPAQPAPVGALAAARRGAVRVLPRSETGFGRLATALVVIMWLNIASGAFVRLTASGLGCPNWPGCTANHPFPEASHHAVIEFSNRVVALCAIVLSVLAWAAARRLRRPVPDRRLALVVAGLTLFQAPLGAITVHFNLNPLLVMSHFLVAILATTAAVALWARTWRSPGTGDRPRYAQPAALGTGLFGFALFVSGAFSTAAGPHSGGQDIRRYGNWWTATHWHVVVATSFVVVLCALLALVWRSSYRPPHVGALTIALLTLLPVQAFIGEYQRMHGLPWGVVLAHVSVAAAVWIATVALVTRIAAPPAAADV